MAERNAKKKSQSSGNASATSEEDRHALLESHGYKVTRNIGKGSYATVKLAESDQHNGTVAIKIVSKFQAPSDYLKKFLPREIQVVKGLTHPNLIKFHQAIETTHRVYIIMEFAENGSLLEMIQKDSYIDEPRARNWYQQLLNAIEFCHANGVVHRDVKCENLLMDSDYHIKLSDFGFARGNMGTIESKYVLSDTFCGSYAYASPEILKGVPYRPQYADIWSSGVVLYATVFGRLPFDDSNYNSLLKQVQKPINFPREPVVSGECKALLRKILAPLSERLRIPAIREESWMRIGESRSSKSVKSNKSTPKPVVTKEEDDEDDDVSKESGSKESLSKESLSKESVIKEMPKKKPVIKLKKKN